MDFSEKQEGHQERVLEYPSGSTESAESAERAERPVTFGDEDKSHMSAAGDIGFNDHIFVPPEG